MENNRNFLRFFDKEQYEKEVPESDEKKKKPFPSFQKPYDDQQPLIELVSPKNFTIGKKPFLDVLNKE